MGTIKRKATGTESLKLEDCPCCGGDIEVGHCGYSQFNPGWAKCNDDCGREWSFDIVDGEWDAGKKWNKRAKEINRKLKLLSILKVDVKHTTSRDFEREDLEDEAKEMLYGFENLVIGAKE